MGKKIFQFVPKANIKRSTFDLSHSRKLSTKIGQLTPVLVQEVLPGDTFDISTESFIRFAPMIAPVMHKINAYIHYFFVPNHVIWAGWEDFITGKVAGAAPSFFIDRALETGGLCDHMGLPAGENLSAPNHIEINALPFRAYLKIWNDYYRDANIMNEMDVEANDGNFQGMGLKYRCWEKDYFTSALPTPQLGVTPVTMAATLTYKDARVKPVAGVVADGQAVQVGPADGSSGYNFLKTSANANHLRIDNLQEVNIDVEEWRRVTRLQRFLERSMRSGNRYFEHLLAHWGVFSKDQRLQRAEYIGGGKTPIIISEVANTTGTTEAAQGSLAGNGLGYGTQNRAHKFCEEHGFIIGIMSVLPETAYSQGIHRMFDRKLNLDYYFPEFANLGEQEVKNQEILIVDDTISNQQTFGYQSRFAEYKYASNTVHGTMRKDLNFWHMGRVFVDVPDLNAEFLQADRIAADPNPWRIFAVTNAEQMYIQLYHHIKAIRPMPFLNDPGL